jgi:hypothetical protein
MYKSRAQAYEIRNPAGDPTQVRIVKELSGRRDPGSTVTENMAASAIGEYFHQHGGSTGALCGIGFRHPRWRAGDFHDKGGRDAI